MVKVTTRVPYHRRRSFFFFDREREREREEKERKKERGERERAQFYLKKTTASRSNYGALCALVP